MGGGGIYYTAVLNHGAKVKYINFSDYFIHEETENGGNQIINWGHTGSKS